MFGGRANDPKNAHGLTRPEPAGPAMPPRDAGDNIALETGTRISAYIGSSPERAAKFWRSLLGSHLEVLAARLNNDIGGGSSPGADRSSVDRKLVTLTPPLMELALASRANFAADVDRFLSQNPTGVDKIAEQHFPFLARSTVRASAPFAWDGGILNNLPQVRFDFATRRAAVTPTIGKLAAMAVPLTRNSNFDHLARAAWEVLKDEVVYFHVTSVNSLPSIARVGLRGGLGIFSTETIRFAKDLERRLSSGGQLLFGPIMDKCARCTSLTAFLDPDMNDIALRGAEKIMAVSHLISTAEAENRVRPEERELISAIKREVDAYGLTHGWVLLGVKGAVLEQGAPKGAIAALKGAMEKQANARVETSRTVGQALLRALHPGRCPIELELRAVNPTDIVALADHGYVRSAG